MKPPAWLEDAAARGKAMERAAREARRPREWVKKRDAAKARRAYGSMILGPYPGRAAEKEGKP